MTDYQQVIADMGTRARTAFAALSSATDAQKADALRAAASAVRTAQTQILTANQQDMANGSAAGLSDAMLDRLMIDETRLEGIASAVEQVASLADPVGAVIDHSEQSNGLVMERVRVPLGVLGIIYESRPNVHCGCRGFGVAVRQCSNFAGRIGGNREQSRDS